MAIGWIKIESETPDKPELLKVARILGVDRDLVMGKLIRLWRWFDANSTDGVVDGVVDADVDAMASQVGFADALKVVGWYASDEKTERVWLPNFEHHNGETAKRRATKSRRQSVWRERQRREAVDGVVDKTPSTREEKRRERVHSASACGKPTPEGSSVAEQLFEKFWSAYPSRKGKKRGKAKSLAIWKREIKAADRELVIKAAANYAASQDAGDGFAKDPERFLKSDWWRDWLNGDGPTSRCPTDEDLANWRP